MQFDRPLLGDITGLSCVHLQCHIGTDTLCLARLGAASVIGLDFSPGSLIEAQRLADATAGNGGEKLKFVEASVFESLQKLDKASFDLVFTGIGALCWLHDIRDWAKVVSDLLKPGGRLFLREVHPITWTVDDKPRNELVIKFPYFKNNELRIFDNARTYVDSEGKELNATKSVQFNHGLGEIIQALLDEGMRISGLVEHQSVPYEAVRGQMKMDSQGEGTSTLSW